MEKQEKKIVDFISLYAKNIFTIEKIFNEAERSFFKLYPNEKEKYKLELERIEQNLKDVFQNFDYNEEKLKLRIMFNSKSMQKIDFFEDEISFIKEEECSLCNKKFEFIPLLSVFFDEKYKDDNIYKELSKNLLKKQKILIQLSSFWPYSDFKNNKLIFILNSDKEEKIKNLWKNNKHLFYSNFLDCLEWEIYNSWGQKNVSILRVRMIWKSLLTNIINYINRCEKSSFAIPEDLLHNSYSKNSMEKVRNFYNNFSKSNNKELELFWEENTNFFFNKKLEPFYFENIKIKEEIWLFGLYTETSKINFCKNCFLCKFNKNYRKIPWQEMSYYDRNYLKRIIDIKLEENKDRDASNIYFDNLNYIEDNEFILLDFSTPVLEIGNILTYEINKKREIIENEELKKDNIDKNIKDRGLSIFCFFLIIFNILSLFSVFKIKNKK